MIDAMEWFLIFFMFYVFVSIWVFTNMLERIHRMLERISEKIREGR